MCVVVMVVVVGVCSGDHASPAPVSISLSLSLRSLQRDKGPVLSADITGHLMVPTSDHTENRTFSGCVNTG